MDKGKIVNEAKEMIKDLLYRYGCEDNLDKFKSNLTRTKEKLIFYPRKRKYSLAEIQVLYHTIREEMGIDKFIVYPVGGELSTITNEELNFYKEKFAEMAS